MDTGYPAFIPGPYCENEKKVATGEPVKNSIPLEGSSQADEDTALKEDAS